MNVAELIEWLKQQPAEAEVRCHVAGDGGGFMEPAIVGETVELVPKNDTPGEVWFGSY